MDAGSAFFEEFGGLGDALFDADLFGFDGIVTGAFQIALQTFRQAGTANGSDAHDLLGGENREETRDDGNGDAEVARGFDEIEIMAVVVKELCDDAIGAGIDFAFQVGEVGFKVGRFDVLLGIACDGDAHGTDAAVLLMRADEFDELVGVAEAVFGRDELHLTGGGITAEGDDVAYAGVVDALEDDFEVRFAGTDAGEVAGSGDFIAVLNAGGDIEGAFLGGAERAVSDGHEVGTQTDDLGQDLFEILHRRVRLWGEDFEGDDWITLLAEDLAKRQHIQ